MTHASAQRVLPNLQALSIQPAQIKGRSETTTFKVLLLSCIRYNSCGAEL